MNTNTEPVLSNPAFAELLILILAGVLIVSVVWAIFRRNL